MLSSNLPASPPIPYVRSLAAQPRVTSFLDLSAELRNEIYVLALVVPDPLIIISGRVYRHLADENDTLVEIGEPCCKSIAMIRSNFESNLLISTKISRSRYNRHRSSRTSQL
jgi:hypothetical protein